MSSSSSSFTPSSSATSVLTAEFRGKTQLLPYSPSDSVRAFRAMLGEALGLPAAELQLSIARTGALLLDERAMLEYALEASDTIRIAHVTTLRAVLAGSAALLSQHATKLLFLAAVPLVIYFGLRRRGTPFAALLGAARMPFAD